jgi:hypothetical protein
MALVIIPLAAGESSGDSKETTQTTENPTTVQTSDASEETEPVTGGASLMDIADAIVSIEEIRFSPMVAPIEVGTEWMPGFTSAVTGYKECVQFAPMIGVIPFVGYVFRVENGTDIEAFKAQLAEKSDLRWNICTEANTKICENIGNIILFAMIKIDADSGLSVGTDAKMIAAFNAEANK